MACLSTVHLRRGGMHFAFRFLQTELVVRERNKVRCCGKFGTTPPTTTVEKALMHSEQSSELLASCSPHHSEGPVLRLCNLKAFLQQSSVRGHTSMFASSVAFRTYLRRMLGRLDPSVTAFHVHPACSSNGRTTEPQT